MAKSYTMPDDLKASSFVEKEGKYHILVTAVIEEPTKENGELIDAIQLEGICEGGTDPSQAKKSLQIKFFNGTSDKDGGAFAAKKQLRLADACNLLKPAKPGQEVEVDWKKAAGSQIIVYLKKSDKGYMELDRLHVYHIDDPEVADVPKNMQAVKLIPAANRRMGSDPNNARTTGASGGHGGKTANGGAGQAGGANKTAAGAGATQPKQQQQLAGAGAGASGNGAQQVDMNDL